MNANSEIVFLDTYEALAQALHAIPHAFFVTDSNVSALYPKLAGEHVFVMKAGEDSKTLPVMADICRAMLAAGCDRKTTVVAVGGGVVGDTAGFAAACYMRGVSWVSVPTTLLAQVDSGIGGKTAVDLDDYKNIVGAFHMPRQVLICPSVLASLPPREWLCGMGEIVKTAFLDKSVFAAVVPALAALCRRDETATRAAVCACAAFKHKVVAEDFTEQGCRKILNLGHTVGHALETADSHRRSHGEYVLWGLLAEAFAFAEALTPDACKQLQAAVRLVLADSTPPPFNPDVVAAAAAHDKKNANGKISCMLAVDVGQVREFFTDEQTLASALTAWQTAEAQRGATKIEP